MAFLAVCWEEGGGGFRLMRQEGERRRWEGRFCHSSPATAEPVPAPRGDHCRLGKMEEGGWGRVRERRGGGGRVWKSERRWRDKKEGRMKNEEERGRGEEGEYVRRGKDGG